MTFTFEIIYYSKILFQVVIFKNSNFESFKQSHDKMTKTKVLDLDEFYNFYIDDFFS